MKPLISFIVPIHNRENVLAECIESILKISEEYEILLIDDASTDNTRQIMKEYEKRFSQIHAFYLEENVGPGEARNVGLRNANGEFIAFVDSDDQIIAKNFCEMLMLLKKKNEIEVCVFNHELHYTNGTTRNVTTVREERCYEKDEFLCKFPYILTSPICAYVFRKEFLQKHNLFFQKLFYVEDACFATEVLLQAQRIYTFPKTLYQYRYITENSLVLYGDLNKKIEGVDFFLTQLTSYKTKGTIKKAVEYALFSVCVRSILELMEINFFDKVVFEKTNAYFRLTKEIVKIDSDVKLEFYAGILGAIKQISGQYSKSLIVCPASKYSLALAEIIKKDGAKDIVFADNNPNSPYIEQAKLQGYRVSHLEDLKFADKSQSCVIVFHTSFVCYDIIKQIEQYGLEYDKDFICGLNTD